MDSFPVVFPFAFIFFLKNITENIFWITKILKKLPAYNTSKTHHRFSTSFLKDVLTHFL